MTINYDKDIEDAYNKTVNSELRSLFGQSVLTRRLTGALAEHAEALSKAATASDKYARSLVVATWALAGATVGLVLATIGIIVATLRMAT